MNTAPVKARMIALDSYRELERRIVLNDLNALLARWEFGKKALLDKAKVGRGQWMKQREQIANALGISQAEFGFRIQFLEQYPTRAAATEAFHEYGSWFAITQRGLGRRSTKRADFSDLVSEIAKGVEAGFAKLNQADLTPGARALLDEWKRLKKEVLAQLEQPRDRLSPEAVQFIWEQYISYIIEALQKWPQKAA